jgi:hypothetical protein
MTLAAEGQDAWPAWDPVAMRKAWLKTVHRGPWRPLGCIRCGYPMDFDEGAGARGVFECPVCSARISREETTLLKYVWKDRVPSKQECSRIWKAGWTMGDAIGHAIRAKEEAEQALIDRGWLRQDRGSGLVFWTKPGVNEVPMWLYQALDKEFPR